MASQKRSASCSTGDEARSGWVTVGLLVGGRARCGRRRGVVVGGEGNALAARPPRATARSVAEQAELLPAPLDERIQAQIRLERVEIERVAGEEGAQVVPFDHVPVAALERVAQ